MRSAALPAWALTGARRPRPPLGLAGAGEGAAGPVGPAGQAQQQLLGLGGPSAVLGSPLLLVQLDLHAAAVLDWAWQRPAHASTYPASSMCVTATNATQYLCGIAGF